ncbi:winged helix-turn-helix domain-containing protein [uncultured Frigoribacterium sp.]|uniref:ArsR/SmtB family transcription factor n=1 Tax=uncultured Frigoribacterium sp. TaxID=335377 RepID=UPI0028D2F9E6|nr:winged helix-turn-helix domain-containing protein [uncultured Frigoribacterium sp.]
MTPADPLRADLDELRDALAGALARLDVLEQSVAEGDVGDPGRASSASASASASTSPRDPAAASASGDVFWALDGVKQRLDPPGGIVFAGSVAVPAGPVDWQITLATDGLLAADWAQAAPSLAALGNATRLGLLQAVVGGADTVAQISAEGGLGSTGQLYHHLGQLVATGWLVAAGRGRYAVPPERVVPLLVVLGAAGRTS